MVSLILSHISFGYSNSGIDSIDSGSNQILKSRIIISGKSSIIVESKNNTNIAVSKIETVSGGTFNRSNMQYDEMDIYEQFNENNEEEVVTSFDNGLPSEFTIEKAYPNPFNPVTTIRYGISTSTPVNIVIYDMTGRIVRDNMIGDKTPGWYEFTWRGNDSYGRQVSTGMYLVTMRAGNEFQKQKITFLK